MALPTNHLPGEDITAAWANQVGDEVNDLYGPELVNVVTASGAAVTLPDPDDYELTHATQTAACLFTLPAPVAGRTIVLVAKQNATGGWGRTWAVTGGSSIAWAGGTEPTTTTAANKTDQYVFSSYLGTAWLGQDGGRNF